MRAALNLSLNILSSTIDIAGETAREIFAAWRLKIEALMASRSFTNSAFDVSMRCREELLCYQWLKSRLEVIVSYLPTDVKRRFIIVL